MYLENKRVIPKESVEKFIRKQIYAGKTPLTRDAAHDWFQRSVVGVTRSMVDKFLQKQRVIRENDAHQATTKNRQKRQVKTKGQLHLDLVEVVDAGSPLEGREMRVRPQGTTARVVDTRAGNGAIYIVVTGPHSGGARIVRGERGLRFAISFNGGCFLS